MSTGRSLQATGTGGVFDVAQVPIENGNIYNDLDERVAAFFKKTGIHPERGFVPSILEVQEICVELGDDL